MIFLAFDFDAAYQHTLKVSKFFAKLALSYNELPKNFARYDSVDQTRIREVMAVYEN